MCREVGCCRAGLMQVQRRELGVHFVKYRLIIIPCRNLHLIHNLLPWGRLGRLVDDWLAKSKHPCTWGVVRSRKSSLDQRWELEREFQLINKHSTGKKEGRKSLRTHVVKEGQREGMWWFQASHQEWPWALSEERFQKAWEAILESWDQRCGCNLWHEQWHWGELQLATWKRN